MKKMLFTGIVCGIVVASAAAQTGYKDFTFGMSAEQIKRMVPEASDESLHGGTIPGVCALLMYLYNAEIGSRYSSSIPESCYVYTYLHSLEQQKLIFYLDNNKLYGVEVLDLPESVYAELKTKYGDKKIITLNDYDTVLVDTAVWNDGKRFIVYSKAYSYTTGEYYNTSVFYYDANYLKPLIEKTMQNFRTSRKDRLD
jgi:hypothetical protein